MHLPLSLAETAKNIGYYALDQLDDDSRMRWDPDVELALDSIQRFKSSGDLAAAFKRGGYRFPE